MLVYAGFCNQCQQQPGSRRTRRAIEMNLNAAMSIPAGGQDRGLPVPGAPDVLGLNLPIPTPLSPPPPEFPDGSACRQSSPSNHTGRRFGGRIPTALTVAGLAAFCVWRWQSLTAEAPTPVLIFCLMPPDFPHTHPPGTEMNQCNQSPTRIERDTQKDQPNPT